MELKASVDHAPGAIRLDEWPLLVHAPGQHGPGVRTEDVGVKVEDIAGAARGMDPLDLNALAARFGTTAAHVRQALDYAARNPHLSTGSTITES